MIWVLLVGIALIAFAAAIFGALFIGHAGED